MNKFLCFLLFAGFIAGCGNGAKDPDVSNIKVDVNVKRFEKPFFAIDTNNVLQGLKSVQQQFPTFTNDFVANILGAGQFSDTNQLAQRATKQFVGSYWPVYQSLEKEYADVNWLQQDLKTAFQHVKYYFPKYNVPEVITYVGPFDAPAVAVTSNALAIGLQLFGGKDYAFYNSPQGQQLYPAYISRRFERNYIVTSCMKAVAEDLYADNSSSLPLVEQMIEKGKYWYFLDKVLPKTADSLKTGYTQQQLNWANENEGMIWNFLLQNNHLYNTEPNIAQLYIGEAPNTQGFPDASPGNIGQWVGWQIVKTFAKKNSAITLEQVMQMPAKKIFQEAKYKPK